MDIFILIIIVLIILSIIQSIVRFIRKVRYRKRKREYKKYQKKMKKDFDFCLKEMLNKNIITNNQFNQMKFADFHKQQDFINSQLNLMNENQMNDFSQFMKDSQMMATGMEFGGFNSDLNLNPAQHDMLNQMDHMNDMNNFNNF